MAVSAGVAFLDIVPKLDSKALTGIRGQLNSLGQSFINTGKSLTKSVTLPLVGLGVLAVKAFAEAQEITAQTRSAIESTGGVANVTAGQVQALATSLSNLSGVDDEAIKSSENLLLTFTQIRNRVGEGNDIFDQAAAAVLNVSIRFKKDLRSSAIMVGKALNDPIKGVSSLSRMGIQFTETQKDMIEKLVESGDVLGAQKLILKELEVQAGGAAEAYGNTLSGAIERTKTQVGNLAESFGKTLKPYIMDAADFLQDLVEKFKSLSPAVRRQIVVIAGIAAAIGPVLVVVGTLAKLLSLAFSPAGLVIIGIAALITGLIYLYNHSEAFREVVAKIVDAVREWLPKIATYFKNLGKTIFNALGRAVKALAPLAETLVNFAILVGEKVVGAIKWFQDAWGVAGPIVMSVLGYLGDILIDIAENIMGTLIEAWNNLWPAIQELWNKAKPVLKVLGVILAVVLVGAIMAIANAFKVVVGVASVVIKAIAALLGGLIRIIAGVIDAIVKIFTGGWDVIKTGAALVKTVVIGVWNAIKSAWQTAGRFFADLWNGIVDGASRAWDGLVDGFKGVINGIIRAWNSLDFGFHVTVPDIWGVPHRGETFGVDDIFPDVPYLAKGGVIRQPTLAMVGEAGPEAVIPLSRLRSEPATLRITDWRRGLATLDYELDFMALARGE